MSVSVAHLPASLAKSPPRPCLRAAITAVLLMFWLAHTSLCTCAHSSDRAKPKDGEGGGGPPGGMDEAQYAALAAAGGGAYGETQMP